jgi:hypothetical protein
MAGELKPFLPFYGSKYRDAKRYPSPRGSVCEPFAGSAGYSTYFNPRSVTLVDVDPILVGVWSYLIHVTPAEVLALPDLAVGESVDSLRVPQEARWLIGFWLNRGSAQPKKTRTAFSTRTERSQLVWGLRARERIAAQVDHIRHWRVIEGSYETAPRDAGTYFVDPPYVEKGKYYRHRLSKEDYPRLAGWCLDLPGDVVVCEQHGANWLPFEPLATIKSTRGTSAEVVCLHTARSVCAPFEGRARG